MNNQSESDYDLEDDQPYQRNTNYQIDEPIDDEKEAKVTNEFLFEWF